MSKVSMASIAQQLGVSRTLVSLVLNGKGDQFGISKATQQAVIELAQKLDYQPNSLARTLRTGKSTILGLIVSDIANPFYSRMARTIEDIAWKEGYKLMVCSADEDPAKEVQLFQMLRQSLNAEGIIVSSGLMDAQPYQPSMDKDFPVVFIDRILPDVEGRSVIIDNYRGAERATEHLIESGRKRVALITIGPSHLSSINDRRKGYEAALIKKGFQVNPDVIVEASFDNLEKDTAAAVTKLMKSDYVPDAIFAANNRVGLVVIETLAALGKKIPKDVALICFDDIEAFRVCSPPVTAVEQPVEDLSRHAIERLLKMINKTDSAIATDSATLSPRLIVRQSV